MQYDQKRVRTDAVKVKRKSRGTLDISRATAFCKRCSLSR